ncbi:hypothetical protein D3C72_2122960 [compost metagenome]
MIRESLQVHLRDNASAWIMQPDGNYMRKQTRSKRLHVSQNDMLEMFGGTP